VEAAMDLKVQEVVAGMEGVEAEKETEHP